MQPADTAPICNVKPTRVLMSDSHSGGFRPFTTDVNVNLSSQGAPWEDALILEVNDVPAAEITDCFPQHPTIVLHLACAGGIVERIGTERSFERLEASAGALDFDPAGERTSVRWSDPHKILCMMPTPSIMQRAFMGVLDSNKIELVRANHVRDPQIERIGHALIAECESGFQSGRLFGESMALALASRLISNFSTQRNRLNARLPNGLPLWRLRQVTQYVEENLSLDIRMADLAQVAQMSEFHFSRMFKQSTGSTPYQFILERRIQRSRELLNKGAMPLHEIAAHVGFSDQSHFTTAFKKHTGLTPKQFRDQTR